MLELDSVMVKGRTQPTQLYTFVDMLKADPAHVDELGKSYAEFLTAYRHQDWDKAELLLNQCRSLGVKQLDYCYSLFEERIKSFRQKPPPADWDGSFAMTEK
jgi:adenylate cyclase